jgi:hypothetical protein
VAEPLDLGKIRDEAAARSSIVQGAILGATGTIDRLCVALERALLELDEARAEVADLRDEVKVRGEAILRERAEVERLLEAGAVYSPSGGTLTLRPEVCRACGGARGVALPYFGHVCRCPVVRA